MTKQKEKIMKLTNQLAYLQADIDNLRKHYEKEQKQLTMLSNKRLIFEILTIIDDFEQAIKNEPDENKRKGIEMIHKKLIAILQKKGLKQIKCIGEEFNTKKHEAFIKEGEGNNITEEIQKGYTLNNFIIRTSKVKVGGKLK